jgi:hypothetical protein
MSTIITLEDDSQAKSDFMNNNRDNAVKIERIKVQLSFACELMSLSFVMSMHTFYASLLQTEHRTNSDQWTARCAATKA